MIEHRSIAVDGINVHYAKAGQGPPLLLLHGLGSSWVVWRQNLESLGSQYTVYALDLPGHGDSEKPTLDYSMEAGIRFIGDFLQAIGVSRLRALVGNSMGGMLALAVATHRPSLTDSLILVDSAGLGRDVLLYIRLITLPLVGEILEHPRVGGTALMLKNVFYDRSKVPPTLAAELYRSRSQPGARDAVLSMVRNGVTLRGLRPELMFLDRLSQITAPVLIVWGAEDRIIPVSHAHAAAERLPRAHLEVLPQCGHWPQMERAEEFNRVLSQFLASVESYGRQM